MEHIPNGTEQDVVENIFSLLKKDGYFILTTPNKNLFSILLDPAYFLIGHRHYSFSDLKNYFINSKFKIRKVKYYGGFAMLFAEIAELVSKYFLKRKLNRPRWLDRVVKEEFEKNGFAGIMIVSQK